ncbi:hypothetical protein [Thalassospira marina]|uniref:Cytochrome c domain-containing protein n=1 Tax=Thalassospira marina TaxID=2048283 RepID=A0A2N3KR92_9PROT|nr:hypothetical protein [Thalassospira marina]PKR53072.1 hypothetical protein COO20_15445 [Thalassospira marina]
MKQGTCLYRLVGTAIGIWAMGATATAQAQTYFPPDVDKSKCSLSSSEFQSWITLPLFGLTSPVYDQTSGMPYIFPVNGPNFEAQNPDHCDFYKWGAQMFLWLTSTIDDVSTQPATRHYPPTLPLVFNTEFFYRLSSDHKELLAQGEGGNGDNLAISLRTAKKDEDESIGQAGGNGVLLTQKPADATKQSSLTYYGVHTNRQYGYFLSLYKNLLSGKTKGTPLPPQFPTTAAETCAVLAYAQQNNYVEKGLIPAAIEKLLCPPNGKSGTMTATENPAKPATAPTQSSSIIPQIEPAVDFLSMAVEVKSSWVEAATLPADSAGKYILQNLKIPVYDRSNPNHWMVKESATREMALVGMHVVGTVQGHPEMVWATIEHENNAPNALYYYTNDKNQVVAVSDPQTKTGWLYSNGEIVDAVTEYAKGCDSTPMPAGCIFTSDIVSVGDNEIIGPNGNDPIQPSNVTRLNPWGNAQTQSDTTAISQTTQIISLNRDVKTNLVAQNATDPRQYYFLSGAVWTSDGSIPEHGNATAITGSPLLANTSMETFEQANGCFGCHNTFGSSDGLEISHIFDGISPDLPTVPGN